MKIPHNKNAFDIYKILEKPSRIKYICPISEIRVVDRVRPSAFRSVTSTMSLVALWVTGHTHRVLPNLNRFAAIQPFKFSTMTPFHLQMRITTILATTHRITIIIPEEGPIVIPITPLSIWIHLDIGLIIKPRQVGCHLGTKLARLLCKKKKIENLQIASYKVYIYIEKL